jgi:hypothetical protein
MPIRIELIRPSPCAQLKAAVVCWIAQSSVECGRKRAHSETGAIGQFTGLSTPQPIDDPARSVGYSRQANSRGFDSDDPKWLRPQAGDYQSIRFAEQLQALLRADPADEVRFDAKPAGYLLAASEFWAFAGYSEVQRTPQSALATGCGLHCPRASFARREPAQEEHAIAGLAWRRRIWIGNALRWVGKQMQCILKNAVLDVHLAHVLACHDRGS